MKLLLTIFALISTFSKANSQCTGFKEDSSDHISVGYKIQNRRGQEFPDVTSAEITWKPQEMIQDLTCFQLEESALLFKSELDSEYQTADVEMRPAGDASKW